MTLRTTRLLLIATCAGVVPTPAPAQQPTPPSLRLQVQTDRPSYVLGEPVYLTARLTNQGPGDVRLLARLDPKDGLLAISIRDPRGQGVGFEPLSATDTDTPPTTLAAGQTIGISVPIFFGATGWVFQTPGRFTVRARFDVRPGGAAPRVIESDAVPVTIRDEAGDAGRFLMSGAPGLEAGRFLVWRGGDQLEQGRARLSQFAERYPASPVVDHYRVAVGRSWARPFKDFRRNAVRPADFVQALGELARARDENLPGAVRLEKYLAQASSLIGANRAAEAAAPLRQARALFTGRVELAEFQEQLDRIERASRATGQ